MVDVPNFFKIKRTNFLIFKCLDCTHMCNTTKRTTVLAYGNNFPDKLLAHRFNTFGREPICLIPDSTFYRTEVLGTAKTSDVEARQHLYLFFIYRLVSYLNSLFFVFCFF